MARCDEATHRSHFSRSFVYHSREKCVHSRRSHTMAIERKRKLADFHCSMVVGGPQGMEAERGAFICEILSMHFTQYAPIYFFLLFALASNCERRPANDRRFDLNVNGYVECENSATQKSVRINS